MGGTSQSSNKAWIDPPVPSNSGLHEGLGWDPWVGWKFYICFVFSDCRFTSSKWWCFLCFCLEYWNTTENYNLSPKSLKGTIPQGDFIFQPLSFRGHVSFRGNKSRPFFGPFWKNTFQLRRRWFDPCSSPQHTPWCDGMCRKTNMPAIGIRFLDFRTQKSTKISSIQPNYLEDDSAWWSIPLFPSVFISVLPQCHPRK